MASANHINMLSAAGTGDSGGAFVKRDISCDPGDDGLLYNLE